MAIYHLSVKIGSRANGKSAVASASYRSAEKLYSQTENKTYDYRRKQAVVYTEIMLPENAPKEYADRATLWNSVEAAEKQANAQLYREFEISLPNECTRDDQIAMTRRFADSLRQEGMCVDIAIHDVKAGQYRTKHRKTTIDNCHAHIMCTMRSLDENGKFLAKRMRRYILDPAGYRIPLVDKNGNQKVERKTGRKLWAREDFKTNDWGDKEKVLEWRERWANIANQYLAEENKIDHRSLEEQAKDWEKELERIENELTQARELDKERGERINEQLQRLLQRRANALAADRLADREREIEGENTSNRAANREDTTARKIADRAIRIQQITERREREAAEALRKRKEAERRKQQLAAERKKAEERAAAERARAQAAAEALRKRKEAERRKQQLEAERKKAAERAAAERTREREAHEAYRGFSR